MVSHVNAPNSHKKEVSGVFFEKKELARVEGEKEKTPSTRKWKAKRGPPAQTANRCRWWRWSSGFRCQYLSVWEQKQQQPAASNEALNTYIKSAENGRRNDRVGISLSSWRHYRGGFAHGGGCFFFHHRQTTSCDNQICVIFWFETSEQVSASSAYSAAAAATNNTAEW